MSFASARSSSSSAGLTGAAKLAEVTRLMDILSADLKNISLLPHQRDAHLEQVKVYGRDPTNSDPIFTKEGIETLTRHAFTSPSQTTSRNALRCLANAMLLRAETRKIFVDLGYESKACIQLKNDSRDDEFLVSRIIFLTTYGSGVDIENLIDQHHLAETVCANIARHAKQYTTKQKSVKELDPMEDMALIESLKLLFNVTHFCLQRSSSFTPAVPHILMILTKRGISSSKPLDPPIGTLINSLINLPLEQPDALAALYPKDTPNMHSDRFIEILDKSTKIYKNDDLEQNVSPLFTLIRKVYDAAPKDAQKYLQQLLLPTDEDREKPLGQGQSLSARLLNISSTHASSQIRDLISSLLFELSDKDAKTFVQNVGYGFASGYLFKHQVPLPENALESWSTSESGNSQTQASAGSSNAGPVNPITGQFLDKEAQVDEVPMTQEEKEREAEKLFVLFERLKKTGVMKVQNPVEKAFNEGRFQELDDDADSD